MVVAPLPSSPPQPDHAIACVTVSVRLPASVPPLKLNLSVVPSRFRFSVPPLMDVAPVAYVPLPPMVTVPLLTPSVPAPLMLLAGVKVIT